MDVKEEGWYIFHNDVVFVIVESDSEDSHIDPIDPHPKFLDVYG